MLKEHKKNYNSIPTPHNTDQDFFYYVNKDDEVEVLESLGYNLKQSGYLEEDSRVSKYW